MNEPPGNRLRVALTGLTMAERFRDEGRDILFFVDNIYRFTLAGTEVSALLGRMPSAVGYQPTLAEEMGRLQERITSTKTGSITSIQAVYVPADDLTDPSPATTFGHLDATRRAVARHRVARHLSRRSIRSTRRRARSTRTSSARSTTRRRARVQATLQRYKELRDIIAILGMDELVARGQARGRARAQDPALPVAAVPRRRGVHRLAGQVRVAQGHDQGLQDDRQRRVRRAARAGVLHGRHDRGSVREGEDAAVTAEAIDGHTPSTSTSSAPRSRSSPARRSSSCCPASMGELGIYPRHTPLFTQIKPGAVRIKVPNEARGGARVRRRAASSRCSRTSVTVLADTAIRAKDLDEAKALEAKSRAEEAMKEQALRRGDREGAGRARRRRGAARGDPQAARAEVASP